MAKNLSNLTAMFAAAVALALSFVSGASAHDPSLQALAGYNAVLDKDPDNVEALRSRGSTLRALELYDDAVNDLTRVEKLDPGNPETLAEIGICRYMLGEKEKALEILKRAGAVFDPMIDSGEFDAEKHGPIDRELRETLIKLYSDLGMFEDALEECDRLEIYLGGKPPFLCDKADLLIALDRVDEAVELYEIVFEMNSAYERFCVGTANCYLLLGHHERALQVFEQWEAEDETASLAPMFRSIVLRTWMNDTAGTGEAAPEAIRRARVLTGDKRDADLEDLVLLGRVLQGAGEYEESCRVLEGLLEYFRGHYLVVHLLAVNYRALGRDDEADSMETEARLYRRLNPADWLQAYEIVPPPPAEEEPSTIPSVGFNAVLCGVILLVVIIIYVVLKKR